MKFRDEALKVVGETKKIAIPPRVLKTLGLPTSIPGIRLNPDVYIKIEQVADIQRAKRSGKVGIIYSFEGADMFEGKLDRIDHFSARGVRVMQLSYNKPSVFASGVLSPRADPGIAERRPSAPIRRPVICAGPLVQSA